MRGKLILCGASSYWVVPLFQRGMSRSDRGILMDFLIIDLNGLCAEPITISQPGGELSSEKRACGRVNRSFQG